MSSGVRLDDSRIASLKNELKEWERAFAKNNGGRKAGREDIKRDAAIAAKYKEYDQLRRKPAETKSTPRKNKPKAEREGEVAALKERSANTIRATPKKDSKDNSHFLQPPAAIEEEPTPACVRFALGPTPQKDGEVLGIFDTLVAGTPSKGDSEPIVIPDLAVAATPSKTTTSSTENKPSRTPQSSGKRFFLGAFAGTPLKRKREDEHETPSTAKRQFATPAFLRRNVPLARIDEEDGDIGTTAPPFKRRGLARSFSSIIQGLKKQEAEKLDEEWEIMRDLEDEESGVSKTPAAPKVLVEGSQDVEMPLGPDQGPELSEDEAEVDPGSLDANGNPRKVWKKKGQKRQTKRVKMRPVVHQARKAVDAETSEKGRDGSGVVGEMQDLDDFADMTEDLAAEDGEKIIQLVDEDSDYDDNDGEPGNQRKTSKQPPKKGKANAKTQEDSQDKKGVKVKKVAAQAHANFRKLKIKNKNSKAKGRGGRFGRR